MSRRTLGRFRERFSDDDDYGRDRRGNRPAYRKASYTAAEALFNPAVARPAEQAPPPRSWLSASEPVTATVKWFSAEKGFGFATLADGSDIFIGSRVLGNFVDSLPTGATITVRTVDDGKGRVPSVVELIDIEASTATPATPAVTRSGPRASTGVERGQLLRRDAAGAGFLAPEFGGADIYIPRGCLTDLGVSIEIGDWLEVDVAQGERGPRARRILKKCEGP